jgi:hypothetical protein
MLRSIIISFHYALRRLPAVMCFTIVACARDNASQLAVTAEALAAPAPHEKGASANANAMRADSAARDQQDSVNRTLPGYIVDSILPVEEQLRRFRQVIGGEPVTQLKGGSRSRDALIRRFVRAVVAADSIDLLAMVVTPREFADLIYPESPNVHPPYQQDPALVWRTIQNASISGYRRLVRRAGGIPITLEDYSCDPRPSAQGSNRFWGACQLRLKGAAGDTSTHYFFGSIVERQGAFKFMGYRNEF